MSSIRTLPLVTVVPMILAGSAFPVKQQSKADGSRSEQTILFSRVRALTNRTHHLRIPQVDLPATRFLLDDLERDVSHLNL